MMSRLADRVSLERIKGRKPETPCSVLQVVKRTQKIIIYLKERGLILKAKKAYYCILRNFIRLKVGFLLQ
jgi:hypothetical protein